MIYERLQEIADKFGTPSFVFDEGALKERVRAISEILGQDVTLCYSIKANPFLIPAMLEVAGRLEVCSPGELDICKRLGVSPDRIVYSGVNKTEADVRAAAEYGSGIYTAESLKHVLLLQNEGKRLGRVLPVLLRLNAGTQFGMSKEDLFKVLEKRDKLDGIEIAGIHYFVGTQRKKFSQQRDELAMLKDLYDEIERVFGVRLQKLEYGPGLPVPYFENEDFTDTLAPVKELADALKETASWCDLTVEMGRFYTAECGCYLTKVMDIKAGESTNYCIVDGGMNHLTYLGQIMGMKIPVIKRLEGERDDALERQMREIFAGAGGAAVNDSDDAAEKEMGDAAGKVASENETKSQDSGHDGATSPVQNKEYALCGSLCTTADVIVRQIQLQNLRLGDILAFCNVGAYSVTEGIYLFLSRTMPRILLLKEDGSVVLARNFTESSPLNCMNVQ